MFLVMVATRAVGDKNLESQTPRAESSSAMAVQSENSWGRALRTLYMRVIPSMTPLMVPWAKAWMASLAMSKTPEAPIAHVSMAVMSFCKRPLKRPSMK